MSAATMLTILEEGIDIMLQRIRDTLKKEEQLIAKAKDAVYQEIAESDRRRKHAEERGEPFTEPPPASPENDPKNRIVTSESRQDLLATLFSCFPP